MTPTARIYPWLTPAASAALCDRGDRVRLVRHSDAYSSLAPGAEGTVTLIDSVGTVHVRWDNGSTLGLIPGADEWDVIR